MNNKSKAISFLKDLGIDNELVEEIKSSSKPSQPAESFVVYYVGDKPDTVWRYYHNPADGLDELNDDGTPTGNKVPYGQLYGYWNADEDGKGRHFVEHKSKNLKIMPFDVFMEQVPPNKNCTKIYESEEDFLLELL